MKHISLIINGVLIIAVGFLFYFNFSLKNTMTNLEEELKAQLKKETKAVNKSEIAFINVDSLLLHYRLSEDLNDNILLKQDRAKAELDKQLTNFEKEYTAFQEKAQRGGFLTQQRLEEEQMRLLQKQQDLQNLEMELSNDLMNQQQMMNQQLYDSITQFLKGFNENYGFSYILGASAGGGILYADQAKNYTDTVLNTLNKRYLHRKEQKNK